MYYYSEHHGLIGPFAPVKIRHFTTKWVYDADTLLVDMLTLSNQSVVKKCRLFGINAFEIRGSEREKGKKARAAFLELIKGQQLIMRPVVLSKKAKPDSIFTYSGFEWSFKVGKYRRDLILLYRLSDFLNSSNLPVSINQMLVDQGHAVLADYDKKVTGDLESVYQIFEAVNDNPMDVFNLEKAA